MAETITGYTVPPDADIVKRISWPAVFGGTLVALATELVFVSFGLFIGFQYSSPGGISTWSEIWYFVTAFCALFVGGWATARLSTNTSASGRLQATVTWGLTTMATFTFAIWILWGLLGTSIAMVGTATVATNHVAATTVSPTAEAEANHLQREAANAVGQVNQNGPYIASVIASDASSLFLILFGGILCGCAGALVGGGLGRVGHGSNLPIEGTRTTIRNPNASPRPAGA